MAPHPSRCAATALTAIGLLLALNGCGGSSSSTSVAPSSINRCGVSVSGGGSPIPAGGGSGTLTITVDRECAWTARSESPWISLASAQGQGSANITFSVQPNPDASSRRGGVTVEQQRVEIAQEAAPCRFNVSPSSVDAAAAGGAVSIGVSAPGGCSWTTQSTIPWLSVEPDSGQGSGMVQVVVAPNGPAARSGTVTVAGTAVQVRQAAASGPPPPPSPPPPSPGTCRYALKPTHFEAKAKSDDVEVEVRTTDGCAWTASSPVGWIRIEEGSRGSGDGEVQLHIDENSGPARSATVLIAGEPFTVTQDTRK
jgi:Viral BACON domain/Putative binding domain, N-terminal